MNNYFAKLLIAVGIIAVIVGVLMLLNIKIPFGKLPGDIVIKKENFTFAFPIVHNSEYCFIFCNVDYIEILIFIV